MKIDFTIEERFENKWVRAYSLIYDSYCTSDLKVAIKEEPDFESRIRDNPVELLKEVERLGSIPRKAQYPVLALVETLVGMVTLKQGDKEGLQSEKVWQPVKRVSAELCQ